MAAQRIADEVLVAGVVRAFADQLVPDDQPAADRAVAAAVRALWSGASVPEACRHGRDLVQSEERHPSCCRRRPLVAVR